MTSVAILMSVYRGTRSDELAEALNSITAQTRRPDEIVIVEDGPVSDDVRMTIGDFLAKEMAARAVRLVQNLGSGPARAAGLATIKSDFVAILDSDDIALPHRLERQLQAFTKDPSLDVLGTAVTEFQDKPGNVTGIRRLPESHEEIQKYARINSPINNPSVMMRTSAARTVGSYQALNYLEDYDLFARLLAGGYKFHNLSEPMTLFRTSSAQFKRRTSKGIFSSELQLQRNLVRYGLISRPRALLNIILRSAYRKLPPRILERAYRLLFHKK